MKSKFIELQVLFDNEDPVNELIGKVELEADFLYVLVKGILALHPAADPSHCWVHLKDGSSYCCIMSYNQLKTELKQYADVPTDAQA